nr:protein TIC 100 [Tanacetum cinerariifolium]
DESTPPSFGSDDKNKDSKVNEQKGKNGGRSSPFAACSLQFGSVGLASMVPSQLQQVFMAWKESKWKTKTSRPCSASFNSFRASTDQSTRKSSIEFERTFDQGSLTGQYG